MFGYVKMTIPGSSRCNWQKLNPLLFNSSKIKGYLYNQRVLHPWKKRPDMLSEGNATHPFGCDSPLQIVMAVWRPFCLNSNFLGRVWQPSAANNGAPKGHYYLQRAVTPTRSLSRIVCRVQEAEKELWGLIYRPILDVGFFKNPMSPQDTGKQLWGNPVIVCFRQFRDNEAWI